MLIRNDSNVPLILVHIKFPAKIVISFYTVESGRSLETRIKENKYVVKTANNYNTLFKQVEQTNHSLSWKNWHLLYKCTDYEKRKETKSMSIDKYNFNISGYI